MKTTTKIYTALLTTLAPATALAATGGREDTSGIFVWAFLGLCAMIVAAQVVPALLVAFGAVKGTAEGIRGRHAARALVR